MRHFNIMEPSRAMKAANKRSKQMSAEHTEEEWFVSGQNILTGDGIGIAKVYDNIGQPREANARLIATAPEMITGLESLCEDLENNGEIFGTDQKRIDFIQSIIRKARGE